MEKPQEILSQIGITEKAVRQTFVNMPTESLEKALHVLEEEELALIDEKGGGTKVQTEPFGVTGAPLDEYSPVVERLKEVGLPVNMKTVTEAVRSTRKLKIKVMNEILAQR